MSLQFCFLLNVILLSRLILVRQDKPVTIRQTIGMTLFQVVGLLIYQINYTWAVLAGTLIIVNLLFHFLENKLGKINLLRLLSLATYVILLSIFFSSWLRTDFNPGLLRILPTLGHYSLLLSRLKGFHWLKANILLLGFLLATNEANILIRYLLQILHLAPKRETVTRKTSITTRKISTTSIDQREYNAGRVIGILERALIYFLVLNAQYAATGFILAAKSFTRFKELEKREFAEYVLIGTLLSAFLAMVTAEVIRILLL